LRQVRRKSEVMSPAGYWPQLHAAIEAGADAVYFGLKHFSARAKVGFSMAELPEVMRTLHRRGVRGFVTFNTLVFQHELAEAAQAISEIAGAQADALIIQDYGILRLARQIAPHIELHASTQMSITSAEGVKLAQAYGANRVTLARELSLPEIRKIIDETGVEIEVFVHGALCVAYSGQCFSSEAWGGRSANRGQCAQACRLPYEMWVDGRHRPLDDARYLLSPGDLYALEQVPELVDMGVATLKIEGRYKDADYVALTTRAYRRAVDDAWAGKVAKPDAQEQIQLEQVYSRGLGPWFLTGTNHQTVVKGRAPRHRGVEIGRVARVTPAGVWIESAGLNETNPPPLKPGDGVVFDAANWRSPEEPEEGGRIYQVLPELDGAIELRFANNSVDFSRIRPGDLLWRTHDPDLDRIAKPYTNPSSPVAKQPLNVKVTARAGQQLLTTWTVASRPSVSVTVESQEPLAASQNRALTTDFVTEQLGRLGNTAYELADVELHTNGSPFVPASLLNQVRRQAVELLQAIQSAGDRSIEIRDAAGALAAILPPQSATASTLEPQLHLLVRTPEQLDAAIADRPASITLDYLDLYGLRPSVERVKSESIPVRVASPRVLKPGEERILHFLASLDCPVLVRGAGMIQSLRGVELIGDFSLNAANTITAATYFDLGLTRITPTYDLNAHQIAALAQSIGGERIEAVAYQHLPVFHMEHCVFCRFLSTGTTYRDCGRPCEQHRIALKDTAGRAHPVMADVGCRNTVFGSEAQEASGHLDAWRRAGIRHFRLEFVHESAKQVNRVSAAFRRLFNGEISAMQLNAELRRIAPTGVTEGSLFVPKDYLTLPILQ
jgi:putative protease